MTELSAPQFPGRPGTDVESEQGRRPWKEDGYPALCAWMASSDDFFSFRRFTRTGARVLLYLQNEISRREIELDAMDDFTKCLPGDQGGCGSFNRDIGSPRDKLIRELQPLLKEYCMFSDKSSGRN